jgi:hypothetical protein
VTHVARLRLLLSSILLSALLVAGALAVGVLCLRGDLRAPAIARRALWWFTYTQAPAQYPVVAYTGIIAMAGAGLFFALRLRWSFSRTASAEAYFFGFFLCSLSLDALRVLAALNTHGSPIMMLLVSRAVYSGRLFGTLCLFGASLFGQELRASRLGTFVGIAGLVGLMFSYVLPLDSSVPLANGVYRLGDERGAAMVFFSMYLFVLINPVVTAVREQAVAPLLYAAAFALVLAGRDILTYAPSAAGTAAGAVLLIAGCLLFTARAERASMAM